MGTSAGVVTVPAYAASGKTIRSAVNPLVRAALYLFILSIPFEMPKREFLPVEIPTITGALFLLTTVLRPMSYRRIPGSVIWFFVYLWMFGLSTFVNRSLHPDLVLNLFLLM